jgi:hypothetical protein
LKDDRGRDVFDAIRPQQRQPPERRTHDDAACDGKQERRRHRAQRKAVRCHGADRQAIDQQRAGIIQQALAFENGEKAVRRSQRAEDGGRGGGIRWRDDGAECDGRRPRHPGHQCTRDQADGKGREANGKHDEADERHPIVFEISRRRVIRRVEQDRRDEDSQRQIGRDGEGWRARNEGEDRTADRQKNGIGRTDAAGCGGENDGREDQANERFEFSHQHRLAAILPEPPRTRRYDEGSERRIWPR